MRYAVVIEKAKGNYSAYVPDLPGCVAPSRARHRWPAKGGTGPTVKAVERDIREAIRFHVEGLREDGLPVPPSTSTVEYVEA